MINDYEKYLMEIGEEDKLHLNIRSFWKLVKALVFLIALLNILVADLTHKANDPIPIYGYFYLISLILSVIITHRALSGLIIPFQRFSKSQKSEIIKEGNNYYSKSFFYGCVGMGYFLLFALIADYIFNKSDSNIPDRNMILHVMFFTTLGVLAKTMGAIEFLYYSYKMTNNDSP